MPLPALRKLSSLPFIGRGLVRADSTFTHPYLAHTAATRDVAFKEIGVSSMEELMESIPEALRLKEPLDMPPPMSESEVLSTMEALARKNLAAGDAKAFFLGAGIYRHYVPAFVDHLLQRSEFLTPYTPYQPEVSQGTLRATFEFQSFISRLVSGENGFVSNASVYDISTAIPEAVLMARRINRRNRVLLAPTVSPQYRDVLDTYARADGRLAVEVIDQGGQFQVSQESCQAYIRAITESVDKTTAAVIVQVPDVFGCIGEFEELRDKCRQTKTLLIAAYPDVTALGLLQLPSDFADIVVGDVGSMCGAVNFGGPTAGFFACNPKYLRQLPGRLVGETVDADGNPCLCLTIATREQHIKRERSTSNICTASALCATAFAMHCAALGETGFTDLALACHSRTSQLAERLTADTQCRVLNSTFYHEIAVELPNGVDAEQVVEDLAAEGILAGVPASRLFGEQHPELKSLLLMAATEVTDDAAIETVVAALAKL
jgi:glycine dehydrogenase subunit 1